MTQLNIERALSEFANNLINKPSFVGILYYRKTRKKEAVDFDYQWSNLDYSPQISVAARTLVNSTLKMMELMDIGNMQQSVHLAGEGVIYVVNVVSAWILLVLYRFDQPLAPIEEVLDSLIIHHQALFEAIYEELYRTSGFSELGIGESDVQADES